MRNAGYTCPFCQQVMSLQDGTYRVRYVNFDLNEVQFHNIANPDKQNHNALAVEFHRCPNCDKTSVNVHGIGGQFLDFSTKLIPNSAAKQFPDYIPRAIRSDYEEAVSISDLSPKASAALSRRCLQGIIRDFWGVTGKRSLYEEISSIKDNLPASQWKAIDGLRRIGNIGAHMEKDVNTIVDIEPGEAKKLIALIELLIQQWYINRYEQEQLYADITEIDADKQEARVPTE